LSEVLSQALDDLLLLLGRQGPPSILERFTMEVLSQDPRPTEFVIVGLVVCDDLGDLYVGLRGLYQYRTTGHTWMEAMLRIDHSRGVVCNPYWRLDSRLLLLYPDVLSHLG
jgi:hypothetical protein